MPDITMSNEDLDLTVAILANGPAVAGSRTLASKFEQAWIAQSGPDGKPTPVSCSEDELRVASAVMEASHEPGADALKAQFDAALEPPVEGGGENETIAGGGENETVREGLGNDDVRIGEGNDWVR